MKKTLSALLIIFLSFSFSSCNGEKTVTEYNEPKDKIKGIWISCYELDFSDKSEIGFTREIERIFKDIHNKGFNTVFVHIRSHSDSYYKSESFPISSFIAGIQGKAIDYDPLEIMIYFAKIYSLKIHGWINPFRVLIDNNISSLSKKNPAYKLIKEKDRRVRYANGGYYYNPAYEWVQRLIIDGIKEVLDNYKLDGIHFDDYFYPTTEKSFDDEEYKKSKSSLDLDDWRRENINTLIKRVYTLVNSYNIQFGISPHCSFYYNYRLQYADIEKWCNQDGYIDYIAPQIYFGFTEGLKTQQNQPLEFTECLDYWKKRISGIPIYIGLALYRCEENGEFKNDNKIIAKQMEIAEKQTDGFIIFSYSYLSRNKKQTENIIEKLKPMS